MNLFNYSDYKAFLADKIERNRHVKGYQAQLAKSAGCQASFLSRALHSHVHLTLDQGAQLCAFWNFDGDETDYFLDLMNLDRASSPTLKTRIQQRLKELRDRNENSTITTNGTGELSSESVYYSAWHYAAIYIALQIPGCNTVERLTRKLQLSPEMVNRCLAELTTIGMVERVGTSWRTTTKSLHLPKHSPMTSINQLSWRQKAVMNLQKNPDHGIHYSSVFALAKSDADKIKKELWEAIDRVHEIVGPSQEEEIVALNVDYFPL